MTKLSETFRRVARAPARPVAGYLNRRFEDVHGHVENETAVVNARLDDVVATTRELQERVTTDLEVLSELALSLERVVRRLEERLDALEPERELGAKA